MININFLLIGLLIVACGNNAIQVVETQTLEPILSTPTKEEIRSTSTPFPTQFLPDTTYNFPEWVKDLNTPILAALLENHITNTREIVFFNAETGEEFVFDMPNNTNGYFWYDSLNFGLLSKDLKIAYKINVLNGEVVSQEISSEAIRLINPEWHHGLEIFTDSNGKITFDDATWNLENSLDKFFTAEKKSYWNGIIVTNNLTNETIWELTTPEGVYITEYLWSPTDNNLLAYIQGKPDPIATDFIVMDVSLNIVDVTTGELHATYAGDFGRPKWSPDGTMILFQNAESVLSNYGVGFIDAPCILFINSGEMKCLRGIPKRIPTGYELASTGVYKWEPERESIFFIYLYWLPEKSKFAGEICEYSLINGNINCFTENLPELDERSAGSYSLSPSKEYIYFCISDSSILNDYADFSNDSIMRIDGTGYFSWVSIIQDGGPQVCTFDELWRPLP
ncbi:MAG TPA: hypothetical protein DCX53_03015 [Anaerolineae bacterium]|nr:hypothetical protein [Anaerolineae bacterium]